MLGDMMGERYPANLDFNYSLFLGVGSRWLRVWKDESAVSSGLMYKVHFFLFYFGGSELV